MVDYSLSNQSRTNFRTELNNHLIAIVENNKSVTAPSPAFAYMLWADTTANKLKIRNGANSAWFEIGDLDTANLGLLTNTASVITASLLATDAVETAKIKDANVTLAKLISGTKGAIFVYDQTTQTVKELVPSTSGYVLTDNGVGFEPTWQVVVSSNQYVGSFTRAGGSASGLVAYTGVGFKPTSVIFIGGVKWGTTDNFNVSFADGTTGQLLRWHSDIAPNVNFESTYILRFIDQDGTGNHEQKAVFTSMDSDGFSLTWTKITNPPGSPSASIGYIALK